MLKVYYLKYSDDNFYIIENFVLKTLKLTPNLKQSYKAYNDWLYSQAIRYLVLSKNLNKTYSELVFLKTSEGKPYLDNEKIHFNISHSANAVVISIADKPVGIDIQVIVKKRSLKNIAQRFFGDKEWQIIKKSANFENSFYQLWCLKEAYGKMLGNGIQSFKTHSFKFKNNKWLAENKNIRFFLSQKSGEYLAVVLKN